MISCLIAVIQSGQEVQWTIQKIDNLYLPKWNQPCLNCFLINLYCNFFKTKIFLITFLRVFSLISLYHSCSHFGQWANDFLYLNHRLWRILANGVTPIPPAIKTACSELNIRLDAVPNGPSIEIYIWINYKICKNKFYNKFN